MPSPFVTQKHTLTEEIGFSVLRASDIIDEISDGMSDRIAARADRKSPKANSTSSPCRRPYRPYQA